MKILFAMMAMLTGGVANSQAIQNVFVSEAGIGQNFVTPLFMANNLPNALVPPMFDGQFLCNNSGVTAVPYACSIGTGLTLSGDTLSAATYTFSVGAPNTRSISLSTAYQATTSSKPASVNINLTSTASLSLTGGTTNSATVYIGSSSSVSSGTGTPICSYSNSNTGTLAIGLNVSTIAGVPCHFDLPSGWYFSIIQTSGTVTITSAYDQPMG